MTTEMVRPKWYRGLRARVTMMLSIAALPIGLIAVFQTSQLTETADKNAELALLALSDQAVQWERLIIQRAFGSAAMLANVVPALTDNPENCSAFLGDFLENERDFSFVGILPISGIVTCSSSEEPLDFSEYDRWPDFLANPRPNIVVNPQAPSSGAAVIVASLPYDIDGEFAGYVSVSIPQAKLEERKAFADLPVDGLVALYTFNRAGDVLTSENDAASAVDLLPDDLDPAVFSVTKAWSFRDAARSGETYIYTFVPVSDSPMVIVGIWNATRFADQQLLQSTIPASLFPILMWIASVVVAVMALYTLVIRHITTLRVQMTDFATNRQMPEVGFDGNAPTELVEIQSRFLEMTDDILREEARLESMLREQNVLAKEVHHRVKNNLQMIASIMNMQIRNAEQDETVETLQRVQDRITSLADVHKDLYTTQDEGRVNVGALINRTVQSSIEMGVADVGKIDFRKEIADVWMYPDQVVPLSLLASEAITNALKYMASAGGQTPVLHVILRQVGEDCVFIVRNSVGEDEVQSGTGIGSKLIRAFSIKLGAAPETGTVDGVFTLEITFPIAAFELESVDY